MFLDLRLKIQTGRDRHSNMTDWIKSAAETVKSKYKQVELDREKQRLDAMVIQAEGPRLWKTLRNALNDAVKEFNTEFKGHGLSDPIHIAFPEEWDVYVSTSYNRVGRASVKLRISVVSGKNTIECALDDADGRVQGPQPPSALYFRASNGGTVHLALQRNESSPKLEALDTSEAVKLLTEPIFLAASTE